MPNTAERLKDRGILPYACCFSLVTENVARHSHSPILVVRTRHAGDVKHIGNNSKMYNKILVPLDGSKLAEGTLPYARLLAGALQVPVDLMHVNDSETVALFNHPTQGADYLKEGAASFPASMTVNCRVENGRAAEVIVDSASRDAGTLISMATHGRFGAQRWLLGSVAQKVLQASINPLLLVRPSKETRPSDEVRLGTLILPHAYSYHYRVRALLCSSTGYTRCVSALPLQKNHYLP